MVERFGCAPQSADLIGGVLDRGVDVGGAHVDLLGDVLVGLQAGVLERLPRGCSPTTRSAASPASMTSPSSFTSKREIPRHRCPPPRHPSRDDINRVKVLDDVVIGASRGFADVGAAFTTVAGTPRRRSVFDRAGARFARVTFSGVDRGTAPRRQALGAAATTWWRESRRADRTGSTERMPGGRCHRAGGLRQVDVARRVGTR